jgi:hypothetical protein
MTKRHRRGGGVNQLAKAWRAAAKSASRHAGAAQRRGGNRCDQLRSIKPRVKPLLSCLLARRRRAALAASRIAQHARHHRGVKGVAAKTRQNIGRRSVMAAAQSVMTARRRNGNQLIPRSASKTGVNGVMA